MCRARILVVIMRVAGRLTSALRGAWSSRHLRLTICRGDSTFPVLVVRVAVVQRRLALPAVVEVQTEWVVV